MPVVSETAGVSQTLGWSLKVSKSSRDVSDVSLSRSDAGEWEGVSYFENGNRDRLEIGVMFRLRFGGLVRGKVGQKNCVEMRLKRRCVLQLLVP